MVQDRRKTSLRDYVLHRGRFEGSALAKDGGPWFAEVDVLRRDIETAGGRWRSFSHYDYLGLADHPDVIAAAAEALDTYGPGVGASRLVGGERSAQRRFEADIADFLGTGAALTLISGYLTNYSLIPHLIGKRDLIVHDELCHNSLLMGIAASGATAVSVPHNDIEAMAAVLRASRYDHRKCLIVIEGLYSMDGDVPDLPAIIDLKHRHDCWLMVDEAHSVGVLGTTGRGVSEHFGTDPTEIDLLIGTLSKTFVSAGGFVAADPEVVWYLRYSLGGFVYSVGPPPASTASAHAALKRLRAEPERVARLRYNSQRFLDLCRKSGLETGSAMGRAVVPVYLPDYHTAFAMGDALLAQGIYVPPVIHVGVPKSRPRLRFFISAAHREDDFRAVMEIAAQAQRPAAE
ncbi:MAG: aminotransferase class I/II-fold pyridoxal phosphate-dependent enzyme [Rhizobiaceae bacterium]